MQKLQNRLVRVLTFPGYDTNADGLLQILRWENLETQRQIHKTITVYKSINGVPPEYFRSKFNDCFLRTNYLRNYFSDAITWNSLPVELRQANSRSSSRSGRSKFFSSRS